MPILATRFDSTAVDVKVDALLLHVVVADGRKISVPLARFPRLRDATDSQKQNWRFIGRGQGIHWPDIDEDILVEGLSRLA